MGLQTVTWERTHPQSTQYPVTAEEEGQTTQEPIERIGFQVTKEETLVFIKAIHIRRSIEPEDLDTQQLFISWTINKKVQTSILWTI